MLMPVPKFQILSVRLRRSILAAISSFSHHRLWCFFLCVFWFGVVVSCISILTWESDSSGWLFVGLSSHLASSEKAGTKCDRRSKSSEGVRDRHVASYQGCPRLSFENG